MRTLLDLSHTLEPDMPRFSGFDVPHIKSVWTHADAAERGYQDTTCEVTEVRFVTSVGTYLDAPFHFDPYGADISQLSSSAANCWREGSDAVMVQCQPETSGGAAF